MLHVDFLNNSYKKSFLLLVMYRCSPYVVLHGSMDVIIAVMKQNINWKTLVISSLHTDHILIISLDFY